MKTQTKLIALFMVLVTFFIAAILWYVNLGEYKKKLLLREFLEEKQETVSSIITLEGKSLETIVFDYTFWDEMVNFVMAGKGTGNGGEYDGWGKLNIDSALATYGVDMVLIYNTDGEVRYSVKRSNIRDTDTSIIPEEAVTEMLAGNKRLCHFFVLVQEGLMEVWGATIHKSYDRERKGEYYGCLFSGHLWDNVYVKQISYFSGVNIILGPVSEESLLPERIKKGKDIVYFSDVFGGWDGRPVAQMAVWAKSDIIDVFNRSEDKLVLVILSFSGFILLFLTISLYILITKPLNRLSATLERGDMGPGRKLLGRKDEFGNFARLIERFFKQKEDLEREILEREKVEKQLKDTQDELLQAGKMTAMGQLAAGIAHELSQPLFIIRGSIQLAQMGISKDSPEEQNNLIISQVDRMSSIIDNISGFSRKDDFKFRKIDINKPIEDSLALTVNQLKLLNIEVERRLAAGLPAVNADPVQLQQVFLNMLNNARDALSEGKNGDGKKIVVESRSGTKDGTIEVAFHDSGCGMSKECQESIFNPFFTTKSPVGMGLGLSISYTIVKRHGGTITVESEPGEGTSFIITLPCVKVSD